MAAFQKTNAARASHSSRIVLSESSCSFYHAHSAVNARRISIPKNAAPQGAGRMITGWGEPRAVHLQHYGGQRPVLPSRKDFLRRPQRPGNQPSSEDAFLVDPSR